MIFFPSTVPPVPSFFCLLCLIPLPLISISHLILNPFLLPSFILSLTRFPSLRSHSFSAYSFLLYVTIYSLYGCLSLFLASRPPLILPFVATSTYFFVYWTVHHLDSLIKRDQLDVTCFLFHYLMLNMFRMLVHPSSGACDLFVELIHGLYCSGSMRVGVTVWLGWGGLVSGYHTAPEHQNAEAYIKLAVSNREQPVA